nr:hypothetical protein B0A51_06544 [Rachicladosporium sp. CCFEE 5018]
MCAVTLTVLADCTHELPTIEYCDKATADVKKYEEKLKCGEKAPVTCDKCKTWLIEKGKRTFGGVAKATGEAGQSAEVTAGVEVDGKAVRSLQHLLKHVQKKSFLSLRR